jgi:dynein heavy chain
MSAQPEKEPLPGEWSEKCDGLRKMIITKIIRRDRVLPAAINFIVEKNGTDTFVNPPGFSLDSAYADSTNKTPIIFILSPGVDPHTQLEAFAKGKAEFIPVSLGQGQAKKAKEKITEGAKNGTWLYLANCHLSLNFLKELEKILETLDMGNVSPGFRLWLSTNPHPKFPISILQKCIKITTEPPKGIKANMLRLYSNMPKDICPQELINKVYYKRSLFALCWFHALIIERKRFKTLGWNIIYDFNDSDF